MNNLETYGSNLFSDEVMREMIPNSIYIAFHKCLKENIPLNNEITRVIATAMKLWAMEKGATHFTHWFAPMTGLTAEKHDAFLELVKEKPIFDFGGRALRKGESDASSFPTGGLRATFEARGYTTWDATSPAFVKDGSLYIPTIFVSYNGEALDKKTPLLRSMEALSKNVTDLLHLLGMRDVQSVKPYVGVEQEYFLLDEKTYQKRLDLKMTGRTLFGAKAPKGQEMEDHYYGSIKMRVGEFMRDLDAELWKYGIPAKTKHNEAAPSQHEIACIYRDANITCDNNQLLMPLIQDVAKKHGLHCLLHEKPYAYVNGSGKHNNWSLMTDTDINIFNPGNDPQHNIVFLAAMACVIKGVDEYADLLRAMTAYAGNDLRLGGNEAPPQIVSLFIGEDLNNLFQSLLTGNEATYNQERFHTGLKVSNDFAKDTTDRNRTSPMAFTGNKFEFRMLGSSQSIAGPNTALNAIFAYEAKEMAERIGKGEEPLDVIKSFYEDHRRIIFNGDGYSKQWAKEAQRRGLPWRKNTYEALATLVDAKNVEMLEKTGVYTKEELLARHEILVESYAKTIHLEASTALMMAERSIYPSVIKALGDLSDILNKAQDQDLPLDYLKADLKELNGAIKELKAKTLDLKAAIKAYEALNDTDQQALFAQDELLSKLNALREVVDRLEGMVDETYWPLPTYAELMFGI